MATQTLHILFFFFFLLPAVRKASLSTRRGQKKKIIVLQPWKYDFTHNPKTLNITLPTSFTKRAAINHCMTLTVGIRRLEDTRLCREKKKKKKARVSVGQVKGRERHPAGLRFCDAHRSAGRKSDSLPTCLVLQGPWLVLRA